MADTADTTIERIEAEFRKNFGVHPVLWWLREAAALLTWGIFLAQLFVFDVWGHLATTFPVAEPVLRYPFLLVLAITAALWAVLGNRRFRLFIGYVTLYPLVLLLWKLPRLLARNWAVLVVFAPAIHSTFTTFRSSFILFTVALVASFLVCLSANSYVVIGGMVVLAIYLLVHYARRFHIAFSPSTVFADVAGALRKSSEGANWRSWQKCPAGLDRRSKEYKEKHGSDLLGAYFTSVALYFVGERVQQVIKSRKLDLYLIGSLIYTFILTTIIFALLFLGLEHVIPSSFANASQATLVDFLGYSFAALMTADISQITPTTGLARAFAYAELVGSLAILVLLVFIRMTSTRERYQEDLDRVVSELGTMSRRLEHAIEENFELSLAGAESWLLEFNNELMWIALSLRYGRDRARQMLVDAKAAAERGTAIDVEAVEVITTTKAEVASPERFVESDGQPIARATDNEPRGTTKA